MKILKTSRAKRIIGHILCHNNLLGRIIEIITEGKNISGIPAPDFINQILKNTDYKSYYELKNKADKRKE